MYLLQHNITAHMHACVTMELCGCGKCIVSTQPIAGCIFIGCRNLYRNVCNVPSRLLVVGAWRFLVFFFSRCSSSRSVFLCVSTCGFVFYVCMCMCGFSCAIYTYIYIYINKHQVSAYAISPKLAQCLICHTDSVGICFTEFRLMLYCLYI